MAAASSVSLDVVSEVCEMALAIVVGWGPPFLYKDGVWGDPYTNTCEAISEPFAGDALLLKFFGVSEADVLSQDIWHTSKVDFCWGFII